MAKSVRTMRVERARRPNPPRRATLSALRTQALAAAPLAALGGASLAHAQEDAAKDPSESRSATFQAVQGAVKEDVPGGPLTVASYGLIWLALLLYVVRLVRLQQRALADVERVERALARTPGAR